MKTEEQAIDVVSLMTEVAEFLGAGWTLKPATPQELESDRVLKAERADIVHLDGRIIWARLNGRYSGFGPSGKLHISGTYPRDNGQYVDPRDVMTYEERQAGKRDDSINVDPKRGAKTIAREIERRLLPTYTDLYNRIVTRIAERNDTRTVSRLNAEALAKALPGGRLGRQEDNGTYIAVSFEGGTLQVCGSSVRFDLYSVNMKVAEGIASVLKHAGDMARIVAEHEAGLPARAGEYYQGPMPFPTPEDKHYLCTCDDKPAQDCPLHGWDLQTWEDDE